MAEQIVNLTSVTENKKIAVMFSEKESVGQDLLPSLIQCFGIIFIGYLFGRFKLIPQSGMKGLCIFIQYLALPALVFKSVATIAFFNVNWTLIASVFTAKAIIFCVVSLMTMLLTRPSHIGKAGLYAIVATQSNDFALGYPLFTSLYKNSHTSYPSFLYVIAPIQLLVLNPAGFFMLEIFKQRQETASVKYSICSVFKGIFLNPIIAMTILGIIWNFAFNHSISCNIDQLLEAFSSTFPAIALFLLGSNMVGKIGLLRGHFSIVPALLVMTKVLVLPLILQKMIVLLSYKFNVSEIQDLSSFGFLYGTIPSAPSVFVFACQYDLSKDAIATTIALCTLISAPLMLVSATMISLSQHGFENLALYMENTIAYSSTLSLLCCVWLLGIFIVGKRWNNISYGATIYLVFAQLITSVGGALRFNKINSNSFLYSQYLLTSGGIFSCRLWTAYLAILLLLLQWRSLCYILRARYIMNIVGFIVSFGVAFSVSSSLLFCTGAPSNYYPYFQLGYVQILTTAILTGICFIVTTFSLVLQHRYRKVNYYSCIDGGPMPYTGCSQDSEPNSIYSNDDGLHQEVREGIYQGINSTSPIDIEDVANEYFVSTEMGSNGSNMNQQGPIFKPFCDSQFHCNVNQKARCREAVEQYANSEDLQENKHILRHVVLLLLLSSSMLVSFAVCLWKLFADASSGIFIELEFLDIVLTQGQGFICFIVFGFDAELIKPLSNMWNRLQTCRKSTESNNDNFTSIPDITC